MSTEIEKALSALHTPSVVVVSDFDALLAENVALAKKVLGNDWRALESDPYMKKLRVLTLRQMHNQADKNETIKQLLVTTATGDALDHLGLGRGVVRDAGEYPYADFEFSLGGGIVDYNVVVPAGTLLNSTDDRYKSETMQDAVILAGEESVIVQAKLLSFSSSSEVVTENIVTDLPFVATAKQLAGFTNGSDAEDDDRYRVRIIDSYILSSTAGSKKSYEYYVRSADSRIDDLSVNSNGEGVINIVVHNFDGVDDLMLENVYNACNSDIVRPISDTVLVNKAKIIDLEIRAELILFDLLDQSNIKQLVETNFNNSYFIGQDLMRSDFIRKCHVDGVYSVITDFTDMKINNDEVINITKTILSFTRFEDA